MHINNRFSYENKKDYMYSSIDYVTRNKRKFVGWGQGQGGSMIIIIIILIMIIIINGWQCNANNNSKDNNHS